MKKTILSLSAVATLLAGVPATYASPVVDSASVVSVSPSPSVKIGHLPANGTNRPDEIGTALVFDASFAAEKVDPEYEALQNQGKVPYKSAPTTNTREISTHTLDSGSQKREYYYLVKGQKISVGVRYNHTSFDANNEPTTTYDHTLPTKELTASENGYYYIEYAAPSGNDQFGTVAHTRID